MNPITLGKKARDVVSGWEGILTARYEYMNGCVRYEISGADKDGKPEGFVFDEQTVVMVDEPAPVVAAATRTGGSQSNRPVAR